MDFKEYKETIRLAYPSVTGQLGHISMGVVDSLMVGVLGAVPLAAASFSNGIFFLLMVIGLGFTYAITPYVAIAKSKGDPKSCGQVLNNGAVISLLIGIILSAIVIFLSSITDKFSQAPAVAEQASTYLHILGWSIIPFTVFQIYRQFSEGLSMMHPPMVVAVLANLFNALFNWVFIHGKMGFPEMGLDGAGYSTLFTRILMAVAMFLYVKYNRKISVYKPFFNLFKVDMKVVKRIFKLGISGGFQYFFELSAFTGATVLAGVLGSTPQAAHQIALNLTSIPYMAGLGVSAAATVRVGKAFGKKDFKGSKDAGISAIILCITFMSLCGLIFITLRDFLPTLYIKDIEVISIASPLLILAALFQISDGIQVVCLGALRGMADAKAPTFITFFSYWIVGIPAAWFLGFKTTLGVKGIWVGLLIGLTSSAILLGTRFLKITSPEYLEK